MSTSQQAAGKQFSLHIDMRKKAVGAMRRRLVDSDDQRGQLAASRNLVTADRNNLARERSGEAGLGERFPLDMATRRDAIGVLLGMLNDDDARTIVAALRALLSAERVNRARDRAAAAGSITDAGERWPIDAAARQQIVAAIDRLLDHADERISLAAVGLLLAVDRLNISAQQAAAARRRKEEKRQACPARPAGTPSTKQNPPPTPPPRSTRTRSTPNPNNPKPYKPKPNAAKRAPNAGNENKPHNSKPRRASKSTTRHGWHGPKMGGTPQPQGGAWRKRIVL